MRLVDKINNYLLADGISPHFKGFLYLAEAISIYKPGAPVTKDLYPAVAYIFGTTASRVERAIRYAREISNSGAGMPNAEYIARAALKVREVEAPQ